MTTTEQDRRMKVADRQALAQYYLDPRVGMPSMANDLMSPNWKAGSSDAEIVMLEILARHRLATEARMAAAVELLRNWMQDGFNSEAEHKELVEQTEAMIRALAKEDS